MCESSSPQAGKNSHLPLREKWRHFNDVISRGIGILPGTNGSVPIFLGSWIAVAPEPAALPESKSKSVGKEVVYSTYLLFL
jgi:hypothetical protein